ncbi:hypothetical protein MNV49_001645 [Pseudohyphozyma bogoriensis]|nr:hypothetical protein MNV49_001645 [Pseudohyphozyma bogoriensis]
MVLSQPLLNSNGAFDDDKDERGVGTSRSPLPTRPASAPGMCQGVEYQQGSWRMRKEGIFMSREALNKGYDLRQGESSYDFCYPANKPQEGMTPAHLDRLLTAASYEWHPVSHCTLTPISRTEVITRLLQSYDGLWMVGDRGHWFLKFNPNHSDAEWYMALAGVPKERFSRPLVRFTRSDRLLSDTEIQAVSRDANGPDFPGSVEAVTPLEWTTSLENAATTHRQLTDDENVYLPTLVLASTGPHWTRALMNMSTVEDVKSLYTITASHVLDVVGRLEVDFYVRSTPPGHPYCWKYHEPEPSFTVDKAQKLVGTIAENALDVGPLSQTFRSH